MGAAQQHGRLQPLGRDRAHHRGLDIAATGRVHRFARRPLHAGRGGIDVQQEGVGRQGAQRGLRRRHSLGGGHRADHQVGIPHRFGRRGRGLDPALRRGEAGLAGRVGEQGIEGGDALYAQGPEVAREDAADFAKADQADVGWLGHGANSLAGAPASLGEGGLHLVGHGLAFQAAGLLGIEDGPHARLEAFYRQILAT